MFWPFTRRRALPRQYLPYASDEFWRVGDIAECCYDDDWHDPDGHPSTGPRLGDRHLVRAVVLHSINHAQMLVFVGVDRMFAASAFRKLVDVDVHEPRRSVSPVPQKAE
jgi:hypothetical protein